MSSPEEHGIWAILIGINYYIPGSKRAIAYSDLSGCVSDVKAVREYLQTINGVRNIAVLTSTKGDGADGPVEDAACLPIFNNIVRELESVTANARPGDVVYIHYSGHGIRRDTGYLESFEEDEGDRISGTALVLADVMAGGAYLTGYQLGCFVKRMVKEKGLRAALVLDSCFSGGGFRDSTERDDCTAIRTGEDGFDNEILESDVEAEVIAALIDPDQEDHDTGFRNATKIRSRSWLADPEGCTILTACDTDETAGETIFEGRAHGKLTFWTLKLLSQSSVECRPSYARLRSYAERSIEGRSSRRKQSPVLLGDVDYVFLSNERVFERPVSYVTERTGDQLDLDVGWAQGVHQGAVYDVFPETENIRPDSVASFKAYIVETPIYDPFLSKALLIPLFKDQYIPSPSCGSASIGKGSSVVLRKWALPEGTHVGISKGVSNPWLDALKMEIQTTPGLVLKSNATAAEKDAFEINWTPDTNQFEIKENGEPVPRIPKISTEDEQSIPKVSYLLSHLARYRSLQEIQSEGCMKSLPSNWFSFKAEVEGDGYYDDEYDDRNDLIVEPGRIAKVSNGTVLLFTFALTEMCPLDCVYVSFYNLDASWGVHKVHPSYGHAFLPVRMGMPRDFRLQMTVPPKFSDGDPDDVVDIIKVFISTSKTCWEEITLPCISTDASNIPPDLLMVPTEVVDVDDGEDERSRNPGDRTATLVRSRSPRQNRTAKKDRWAVLDLKICTATSS